HTASLTIPAIGKEPFPILNGAKATASDGRDTNLIQTQGCQTVDIGHEMARAGTLGVKGFRSFRTVLNKRFAHFRANFETVGTNGGAQPGRKLVRLNRHRTDQVFQHASDEAAPAGVSS